MGLFKAIGKAVKGIVKGVTKAFKSVWKGVKKFASSNIGKIILVGAAIWLGGAALGYWNSGFASIDGALATNAAAAGTAPATAEVASAATTGVGTTATQAATGAATGAAAPGAAVETGLAGVQSVSPFGFTAVPAAPAPVVAGAGGAGGLMSSIGSGIKGAAAWMGANPIPTLIGGQMLSSALAPDELDVLAEQRRIEEERLAQANQNVSEVSGIASLGYTGQSPYPETPTFLQYPHPGQPVYPRRGLMQRG